MEVRVYKRNGKTKSSYLISPEVRCCSTSGEIADAIKRFDEDITFLDWNNGKTDITHISLLNIILVAEKESTAPMMDLAKAIQAGGIIEYIKQLENSLQKQQQLVIN